MWAGRLLCLFTWLQFYFKFLLGQETLIASITVPFNTPFTVSIDHKLRELFQIPLVINCSNGYTDTFPAASKSETEIDLNEEVLAGQECILETAGTDNFFPSNLVKIFITQAEAVLWLEQEQGVAGRDEIAFVMDSTADNSIFALKMHCPLALMGEAPFPLLGVVLPSPITVQHFALPSFAYGNCSVLLESALAGNMKNFNFPPPQPITVFSEISFVDRGSVVDARGFEVEWLVGSGLSPWVQLQSNCTTDDRIQSTNASSLTMWPSSFGVCEVYLTTTEPFYLTPSDPLLVMVQRKLEILHPIPGFVLNSLSFLEILISARFSSPGDLVSVMLECSGGHGFVVEVELEQSVSVQLPDELHIEGECQVYASTDVPRYLPSDRRSLLVHVDGLAVRLKGPCLVVEDESFDLIAQTDDPESRVPLKIRIICSHVQQQEYEQVIITNIPTSFNQSIHSCTYQTAACARGHYAASNRLRINAVPTDSLGHFAFVALPDEGEVLAGSTLSVELTREFLSPETSQCHQRIRIQLICQGIVKASAISPADTPLHLPIPADLSGPCQIIQLPLPGYHIADPLDITIYRRLQVQVDARIIVGSDVPVVITVSGPSADSAILFIDCPSRGTFESEPLPINQPSILNLPPTLGDDTCTMIARVANVLNNLEESKKENMDVSRKENMIVSRKENASSTSIQSSQSHLFYSPSSPLPITTHVPLSLHIDTPVIQAGKVMHVQVDALNGANLPAQICIKCPTACHNEPLTLGTPKQILLPEHLNGVECVVETLAVPDRFISFEGKRVTVHMSESLRRRVVKSLIGGVALQNYKYFVGNAGVGAGNVGAGVGVGAIRAAGVEAVREDAARLEAQEARKDAAQIPQQQSFL